MDILYQYIKKLSRKPTTINIKEKEWSQYQEVISGRRWGA